MTPARPAHPRRVASFDGAIAALRAGGLRVSAARRLVLEALFAAEGPATVEQLADGIGGGGGRPGGGPPPPPPPTPAGGRGAPPPPPPPPPPRAAARPARGRRPPPPR